MARTVELHGEDRLPAPKHELAFLDQQRCEAGQQQLAAVRVAVDRLVDRDLEASREVVVLVAGVAGREALEQLLEVAQEQRLVFVDGESERGVHRLQVDAAGPEARPAHFLADELGDVDEFGGVRRFESQPPGDHAVADKACTRSSRTGRLGLPDAAAVDSPSIALAKATCTACVALSASRREARARQRSPMSRVVAGAAWPPSPWRRIPTSISAAASASLGCISGSWSPTVSRYEQYVSDSPCSHRPS